MGTAKQSERHRSATTEEVLADYPDLEPEDIRQALRYAAWLAQEQIHPA